MTDDLVLGAAHFGALAGCAWRRPAPRPARAAAVAAPAVASRPTHGAAASACRPLPQAVAELEARAIREALQRTGGNKLAAARLLGISRATLYEKLALAGGAPKRPTLQGHKCSAAACHHARHNPTHKEIEHATHRIHRRFGNDGPWHGEEPARQGLPAGLDRAPQHRARGRPAGGGREAGAIAKALAAASDIVFLCVTGSPQVEEAVLGDSGLLAGAAAGTLIVDCSTSEPDSTARLREHCAAAG